MASVGTCAKCGGKMSTAVVVCPHCGARGAVPAKLQLDNDQIRALLVLEGVAQIDDDERDWLATLVLPHPASSGAARAAELALTVVSFPFVMAGALTFALHRLRKRSTRMTMRGELGPLCLMSLFGALGMWSVLSILGVSTGNVITIVLGSIGALVARAVIRTRSKKRLAPAS
jgi:hypothetical protein